MQKTQESRLKRLDNWIWKQFNRKPPGKHSGYWNVAIGWIAVGFFGGFGFLATVAAVKPSLPAAVLAALAFSGVIVFQVYVNLTVDKSAGRMDALDKSEMEHWRERATKLGMNTGVVETVKATETADK
jgi:hypothetical protein